ncbi:MAG: rhomboid family intramembrane serine protease [Alloprevotella sp.]|nr:rhomboid family intramembrane serine protease [Alloprevotella sp.]
MNNIANSIPPVTRWLIIINCAVLILQEVLVRATGIDLANIFGLHFLLASDFYLFQPVTYMFLHGGLAHLFFNMFALWMFGGIIERTLGQKRFIVYYFVCGIGAALCQELWQLTQFFYLGISNYQAVNIGSQVIPMSAFLNSAAWTTVGASGACYGVLLAFGVLYPEQRIMLLIPPIPMKAKYFVFAYAAIELFSAYTSNDNIAHFAHLGGMLFGWLLLHYWRKRGGTGLPLIEGLWKKVSGIFRKERQSPQFRPVGGSGIHGRQSDYEYNLEKKRRQERIDQILEKISRSGYDALTAEEKRELFQYSSK